MEPPLQLMQGWVCPVEGSLTPCLGSQVGRQEEHLTPVLTMGSFMGRLHC